MCEDSAPFSRSRPVHDPSAPMSTCDALGIFRNGLTNSCTGLTGKQVHGNTRCTIIIGSEAMRKCWKWFSRRRSRASNGAARFDSLSIEHPEDADLRVLIVSYNVLHRVCKSPVVHSVNVLRYTYNTRYPPYNILRSRSKLPSKRRQRNLVDVELWPVGIKPSQVPPRKCRSGVPSL